MRDKLIVTIRNSEVLQLFVEDLITKNVDHLVLNDGGKQYRVVMYMPPKTEKEYIRLKEVFEKGILAQERLLELKKQGLY